MHVSIFLLVLPVFVQAQDSSTNSPSNETLTVPSMLRYPWQYLGCYTDNRDDRTVSSSRSSTSNTTTTVDACLSLCANPADLPPSSSGHTFNYAALSYGTECFCGLTLNEASAQVSDDQCNYACSGNTTQPCGGSDHVSVYWNGERAPVVNPGSRRWTNVGCYNDTPTARILSVTSSSGADDMTVYICTSACFNQKYTLAGLEYGRECYCGNQIQGGDSLKTDAASCNMLCAGNATEYCGGDGSMAVYRFQDVSSAETIRINLTSTILGFALVFGWAFMWIGLF